MIHSIIPPSSAGVWSKCTAWVLMNLSYPEDEPTQDSKDGEASHQIGETLLKGMARAQLQHDPHQWIGKVADNGTVYTEEMYEGAAMYADLLGAEMRSASIFGGQYLGIEERVFAHTLIHPLSEGTPDFWMYNRNTHKLTVADYKFGHLHVPVFENMQMINYTAGLFERFNIDGLADQVLDVEFILVQPRSFRSGGPVQRWTTKGSNLRPHFNLLSAKAHEALGPTPTAQSGAHCRDCPGRHACPTALTAGITLFEAAGAPMPVELSDHALGVQLTIVNRAIGALELLKTGYSAQVESKVRTGANVPGWTTEQGYGREKWAKPNEEIILLGDMFGQDLRKPAEPITPKKAIQLGIDAAVIKQYSTTPKTGIRVVPDTDNKAKQVFTQ